MPEFRMPSLGADMEAGTVLAWHVRPGDRVARGQVVMLVDTDKAEIETEIWEDGVVAEILVPVGERVPVGTPLLRLSAGADASAPTPVPPAPRAAAPAPSPPAAPPPAARPPLAPGAAPPRVAASPHARRLARERGIDLAAIAGSGPGGAVQARDLEAAPTPRAEVTGVPAAGTPPATRGKEPLAPERAAPSPERETLAPERLASMRAAIAAAMARSKREIPHYYLAHDIDLSPAASWLARENERRPVAERLLLGVLLVKATARALVRVPELNGHYLDGAFRPGTGIHVGVAIAVRGGGLLAPALLDADQKPLDQLMRELRDLVARARRARLRGAEVNAATITVTSLGELGVDAVYGVIQPPQVALVGFGAPRERPFAAGGLLGVRSVVTATLAADHRVSDGLRGAKLLAAIAQGLAHPETL